MSATIASDGAQAAFRTHLRYLDAWRTATAETYAPDILFGSEGPTSRGLAAAVRADPDWQRLQRRPVDVDLLKRTIFNAWGTELLLALQEELAPSPEEQEILALANQWSVVQSYYALEKGTIALTIALGGQKPDTHEKTRKLYIDFWSRRPYMPFRVTVKEAGPVGFPPGADTSVDHTWTTVHDRNCMGFIATCLRTTRAEWVDAGLSEERARKARARRVAWETEERQRLTAGNRPRQKPTFPDRANLDAVETLAVRNRARPAAFLDYLYRLRIRSNYEDARMFTEGPTSSMEARQMHQYLSRLVGWNLLVMELWMSMLVGTANFRAIVESWLNNKVAANAEHGVATRVPLLFPPKR